MRIPVALSWSGGKDCAMALRELAAGGAYEVVALLTSISQEHRRISHHGVREELLEQQAAALGIPLEKVYLPSGPDRPCTNEVYEQIMGGAMAALKARGISTVAFGDLFLEDLREWREANLARAAMRGLFPLWKRDTTELARQVIADGFGAYLTCVEGRLGPAFAGRAFDQDLLGDLPPGIDPCGENGEFHTFVFDGPVFRNPVPLRAGPVVTRDGRYYADLIPANARAETESVASSIPPV